jgi:hypothetical protein
MVKPFPHDANETLHERQERFSLRVNTVATVVTTLALVCGPVVTLVVTSAVYGEKIAGHDRRIDVLESENRAIRTELGGTLSEISNRLARIEGKLEASGR